MTTMLRPVSLHLISLAACVCLLELVGCSSQDSVQEHGQLFSQTVLESTLPSDPSEEGEVSFVTVTLDDIDCSVDMATATLITLSDQEARIRGAGASLDQNTLTINRSGTYVMSGALVGQVLVDTADTGLVRIVFNNFSVSGQMLAERCEKLLLILRDESDNKIMYAGQSEKLESSGPAVFVNAPLTINGNGSLTIESAEDSGLISTASLVVAGTSLSIRAKSTALRSAESVIFMDSTVDLVAGQHGIDTESDYAGGILFSGGSYRIQAAENGLQSGGAVAVINSDVQINAAHSSVSAAGGVLVLDGELVTVSGQSDISGEPGKYREYTQPTLLVSFETEQEARSTVILWSEEGEALAEIQPEAAYTSIAVSTPSLTLGDCVTFSVNGTQLARVTMEEMEQLLFLP